MDTAVMGLTSFRRITIAKTLAHRREAPMSPDPMSRP
jgi:hypothetical protein